MITRVVAAAYGGPEVLALIEDTLPSPGPGQVLVDVRAAATNPLDCKLYSGTMGNDPASLPMTLGFEASGIVVEVGDDAEGPAGPIRVGDEVIAFWAPGAYATQVLVTGSALVPKPSTFSFEEASGLLLVGATAVHTLAVTSIGAGDTLLIHGASGGVGLIAIQLAVATGARVIGTASETSADELRNLGAEPVVYGPGLADRVRALAPDGVTAAIDCVGTDEALETSVALVADKNRIATIANSRRGLELGVHALGMGPGADPGHDIRERARMDLVGLAEKGDLTVKVAAVYSLADASDAHRALIGGHARGKIVLVP